MTRLWHYVEYLVLRVASGLMVLMPIGVASWITRRIGQVMYWVMPGRRRVAMENLTIAFGDTKTEAEKKRLALQSFYHVCLSMMEFFRVERFIKTAKENIQMEGVEHFEKAFAEGKGAILLMSHLGPWEYLAFVPHLNHYDCTVLGRKIRNPFIQQWILDLRKSVSVKNTPSVGAAKNMMQQLKENHIVAITIDQWAGNDELWVDFFGKPASTISLPTRLMKKTGCALIPTYCRRMAPGKYKIDIYPKIDSGENNEKSVLAITEELNRGLETAIRAYPEQWVWTHKRWKGKKTYMNKKKRGL